MAQNPLINSEFIVKSIDLGIIRDTKMLNVNSMKKRFKRVFLTNQLVKFPKRTRHNIPIKTTTFTYHVDPKSRDRLITLLVSIRKKAAPKKKYGSRIFLSDFGSTFSEKYALANIVIIKRM